MVQDIFYRNDRFETCIQKIILQMGHSRRNRSYSFQPDKLIDIAACIT